ncbi:MAG: glycosyltransferase [Pirellulales bacterium]
MADTTIVIPCYNEAKRLNVDAFIRHGLNDPPHRFLFVNDGSSDATLDLLCDLHDYDGDRFGYLNLLQNRGKAEAVRLGVVAALRQPTKYIGYWDADLATPLDEIESFRRILENDDRLELILGSRIRMLGRSIHRRPHRHLLGRCFASAASHVLRLGVYDTQCGAKMFRVTKSVREVFKTPFKTNWIFDVELLARMIRQRRENNLAPVENVLYEQPLHHWKDVGGSKLRTHDFFKALLELMVIYRSYLRGLAGNPIEASQHLADRRQMVPDAASFRSRSAKFPNVPGTRRPGHAE